MTNDMEIDPWNEIFSVLVRNGSTSIQEETKPTHRWMIEGVAHIVDPFARYLPDLNIPLNINDQCRVAVPWEDIEDLKKRARSRKFGENLIKNWSDRSDAWKPNDVAHRTSRHMFFDAKFQEVFDPIARPTCPPGSKARSTFIKNQREVCLDCAAPHSLDQFVANWTLSGDICHQPDLAYLHGIFLSPSSFLVSKKLLPVFSQSRVGGFNDILYPSAWNYMDKVQYDPSKDVDWDSKEPTLFWRGATSEASSVDHRWVGMARQRTVHFANNHTYPVSVLLSNPNGNGYTYKTFPSSFAVQTTGLQISMYIGEVIRGDEEDLEVEKAEFGVAPHVPFDTHWQNRYLFDGDGAAFSGRFPPFLESHSLPFRLALFRQWLDARLTAWVHYVPVDVRLHGLWSTLAYFTGLGDAEAVKAGRGIAAHDTAAKGIAEGGREWARQVLRKEDMEIYMFRLLLEWARLTDDNRDNLGFEV